MPCFVGNREHDDVAPFLGATDREHAHPRRSGRQRPAVGIGRCHVHQFSGRAGDPVQERARRGHRGRGGQIADPGRHEPRLGRGLGNLFDRARFGDVRPDIDLRVQRTWASKIGAKSPTSRFSLRTPTPWTGIIAYHTVTTWPRRPIQSCVAASAHDAAAPAAPPIDLAALRGYRYARVQEQLRAHDCAAALLYNPINIRYATDSRNMTVWMLHNMGRYCVVPAVGHAVLFEYANRNCIALSEPAYQRLAKYARR